MHHIFVTNEEISGAEIRVTSDDAHHLRDVLRVRPGEAVLVSAGDEWEYHCEVAGFEGEEILLRITDAQKPGRELPSRITVLQCLPKGDKMETVIQKAVELGACEIVPVASGRCVVKLDAKRAEAKVRRWNAVARAAAEQAGRAIVPGVRNVMSLDEVLKDASLCAHHPHVLIMAYEGAADMSATRELLESIRPGQPVAVLIGPEGGFAPEEVAAAEDAGFRAITLGRRILRTETAGMALLSVLAYLLEEA